MDALWSDPKNTNGVEANEARGGGSCFGPNVTKKMLKDNKLKLIIRSHECKEYGYEYSHDQSLLTIFSASNYYEYDSNNGAFVRILVNAKPVIVQFQIKTDPPFSTKNLCFREKVSHYESSAIKNLLQNFILKEKELMQEFRLRDKESRGSLVIADWCDILSDVLKLKLPWRLLRPRIADIDKNGLVLYESTFKKINLKGDAANLLVII